MRESRRDAGQKELAAADGQPPCRGVRRQNGGTEGRRPAGRAAPARAGAGDRQLGDSAGSVLARTRGDDSAAEPKRVRDVIIDVTLRHEFHGSCAHHQHNGECDSHLDVNEARRKSLAGVAVSMSLNDPV